MAKFVDVWTFDWDKYSPDDLVQKCDSFQPGPALLAPLVKSSRATTCGARARLRRPRSGSIRPCPRVMAASRSANAVPRQMSALGQKRTFAVQKGMSALPPIADIGGAKRNVRYVPIADIG
jgi:hypothetical protein